MTVHVDIKDPAVTLATVVDKARHGEDVVLTEAGAPVAKVVAVPAKVSRRAAAGSMAEWKGLLPLATMPTDEETIRDFGL